MTESLTRRLSWLRKVFGAPSLTELAQSTYVMDAAKTMVAAYYYMLPFASLIYLGSNAIGRANFQPFWPVRWIEWLGLDFQEGTLLIKLLFIGIALAGVFLYQRRSLRIAAFLMIWQIHALESSFGSMNHQWYEWVYSSFILIFLPDIWRNQSLNASRNFLFCIWTMQAMIALVYSMAGFNKFALAVEQMLAGEIHGFSPMAFAYQVADWVPKLQAPALLAPYIIEYPYVSWIPYLLLMLFQLCSLWVMVRPGLHRIWGAVFILFHISTMLAMGISFHPLVILISIVFLMSPFVKEYGSLHAFYRDLPLVEQALSWWKSTGKTIHLRMQKRLRL